MQWATAYIKEGKAEMVLEFFITQAKHFSCAHMCDLKVSKAWIMLPVETVEWSALAQLCQRDLCSLGFTLKLSMNEGVLGLCDAKLHGHKCMQQSCTSHMGYNFVHYAVM